MMKLTETQRLLTAILGAMGLLTGAISLLSGNAAPFAGWAFAVLTMGLAAGIYKLLGRWTTL